MKRRLDNLKIALLHMSAPLLKKMGKFERLRLDRIGRVNAVAKKLLLGSAANIIRARGKIAKDQRVTAADLILSETDFVALIAIFKPVGQRPMTNEEMLDVYDHFGYVFNTYVAWVIVSYLVL